MEASENHGTQPDFVCGIGASAGGLEPLERFFAAVPPETGVAFVVVQHLSPDHESVMAQILAAHTDLPISVATQSTALEADHIYLIAPGTELSISDSRLRVIDLASAEAKPYRSIDVFLMSLAREYGQRCAGIILSGTGSDGAVGLHEVSASGGLTLVQDDSAEFDGMPSAATSTARHDGIMAPAAMAAAVVEFATNATRPGAAESAAVLSEQEMVLIAELERTSGVPFTEYKAAPIRRRLAQRTDRAGLTMSEYATLVRSDEAERNALLASLLIDVTSFFRDAAVFEILDRDVIPELVLEAANSSRPVRVWVPGCATGEEAYSLGMLLLDALERLQGTLPGVQIFATDIRGDIFRAGLNESFTEDQMDGVSSERRQRYFEREGSMWNVGTRLRSVVTFVDHNLLDDPPFTRIDLVSCRNLLIYFREAAQTRALATMSYGLRDSGVLVQGTSENLGAAEADFQSINSSWRIWRKTGRSLESARPARLRTPTVVPVVPRTRPGLVDHRLLRAYDSLLEAQMICGLLIAENGELLHTFGAAHEWIQQQRGRPTLDAIAMVGDPTLRLNLSAIVRELQSSDEVVVQRRVFVSSGDQEEHREQVMLAGRSLVSGDDRSFLLFATPVEDPLVAGQTPLVAGQTDANPTGPVLVAPPGVDHLAQLEAELAFMRDSLRSAIEEQETSDEELNAANEELISSNEELQSSNEELSSVNEELRTLNEEHRRRLEQVLDLSADLEQLMSSTEMAVVFLAEDQTVRRFNEPARNYFRIRESDIGRPFADIVCLLDVEGLTDSVQQAADGGARSMRRARVDGDGPSELLLQIDRYELPRQRWGVSVSVMDVSEIVLVAEREVLFASFLQAAPIKFSIFDQANRWIFASHAGATALSAEEYVGLTPDAVYPPEFAIRISEHNQAVLRSGEPQSRIESPDLDGSIADEATVMMKFPFEIDGLDCVGGIRFPVHAVAELADMHLHGTVLEQICAGGALGVLTWDRDGQLVDQHIRTDLVENAPSIDESSRQQVGQAIRAALDDGESTRVLIQTTPNPGESKRWREIRINAVSEGPIAVVATAVDVDGYMQEILSLRKQLGDHTPDIVDLTKLISPEAEPPRNGSANAAELTLFEQEPSAASTGAPHGWNV